jgi:hypothetical protein
MKHTRWIIFLITVNMLVSVHVLAQMMLGNELQVGDIRLSRTEVQKRFRQEIERLKTEAPERLPILSYEYLIEQVTLFGDGGKELLFAAADIAHHNLDEFRREFPVLAAIAELKFIGDVDADDMDEIVGSLSYESREWDIYVFKQKAVGVIRYEHKLTTEFGQLLSVDVQTTSNGEVRLVGRTIVAGHLPVKGDRSRRVEYESLYETEIRFTGMRFEIITPMQLIKQEVILDE